MLKHLKNKIKKWFHQGTKSDIYYKCASCQQIYTFNTCEFAYTTIDHAFEDYEQNKKEATLMVLSTKWWLCDYCMKSQNIHLVNSSHP